MTAAAAEAAALAAAGRDLLRVDRPADAAAAFEQALQALGEAGPALLRAEVVAALAEARLECGRIGDSDALLGDALRLLVPPDATPRAAAAAAWLLLGQARLRVRERQLAAGRALLEAALSRLPADAAPLLTARTEGLLGGVLAMSGDLVPALERFQAARARFATPALAGFVRDDARLAMNIAIAQSEFGRHGQAEAAIDEALALFDGLVRAGRAETLTELARARRNHGYIIARQGRQAAAAETLRAAVDAFEEAARRPGPDRDRAFWRASAAGTLNSLGYSLHRLGEDEAAEQVLRRSLRSFVRVLRELPAQADEQSRSLVNLAHVEAARGRFAAAARHYRRGRDTLRGLAASGRASLAADAANAALGLARVQLRLGRAAAAAHEFEPALAHYADATRQGRLQHALAWTDAWLAQVRAWIDAGAEHGERVVSHDQALLRALARPPLRPAGEGPEPLRALADAAAPLAQWAPQVPAVLAEGYEAIAAAWLEHLFDASATRLAESPPAWLQAHAAEVARSVGALGDAAAARRDAARLLAAWFLGTRGLRAQRSALAEGGDPRLAELNALLQRLHALESEMLGQAPAAPPADQPPDTARAGTAPDWAPAPSLYGERREAEWRALRERLEPLRRPLVGEGLLPERPQLEVQRVAADLAPGEALLLVARAAADRLRVVALRRPAADGRFAVHHEARLDSDLAAFRAEPLHALARGAMVAAARGQPWRAGPFSEQPAKEAESAIEGDAFALELFTRLWRQALAPAVAALARQGVSRFALVPADDLHLVPWNHLADAALPADADFLLYPSVAAWWRRPRSEAAAPARWAVAAAPGTVGRPLPWVAVEQALAARLWGESMQPLAFDTEGRPCDDGAEALLGLGHGGMPEGNPARAGLALGGSRVLGAADLARLAACRRALLSACLLGRTEDVQGEGLGFLSACLDWRVGCAAGWLTEVPDYAACLYSLAAQWSLRAAGAAPWSATLRQLRRTLAAGRWPEGFGDWLAREAVPSTPALQAVVAAPPALLQRALPWAVVLGE